MLEHRSRNEHLLTSRTGLDLNGNRHSGTEIDEAVLYCICVIEARRVGRSSFAAGASVPIVSLGL
jgi:hypothetical protein